MAVRGSRASEIQIAAEPNDLDSKEYEEIKGKEHPRKNHARDINFFFPSEISNYCSECIIY